MQQGHHVGALTPVHHGLDREARLESQHIQLPRLRPGLQDIRISEQLGHFLHFIPRTKDVGGIVLRFELQYGLIQGEFAGALAQQVVQILQHLGAGVRIHEAQAHHIKCHTILRGPFPGRLLRHGGPEGNIELRSPPRFHLDQVRLCPKELFELHKPKAQLVEHRILGEHGLL